MQASLEQRYAIKFCVKMGNSASETLEMLRKAYGQARLHRSTDGTKLSRMDARVWKMNNDQDASLHLRKVRYPPPPNSSSILTKK
jgi:hypothetical protein